MDFETPPPLPNRKNPWKKGGLILLIGMAAIIGLIGVSIVVLRELRLIEPFSVPTSGMSPTINRGDQLYVERFTYLARKPQRGDVVVFRVVFTPVLNQG